MSLRLSDILLCLSIKHLTYLIGLKRNLHIISIILYLLFILSSPASRLEMLVVFPNCTCQAYSSDTWHVSLKFYFMCMGRKKTQERKKWIKWNWVCEFYIHQMRWKDPVVESEILKSKTLFILFLGNLLLILRHLKSLFLYFMKAFNFLSDSPQQQTLLTGASRPPQ